MHACSGSRREFQVAFILIRVKKRNGKPVESEGILFAKGRGEEREKEDGIV